MKNRVLITGSRGFTGHFVSAEFEAYGREVWGVGQQPAAGTQRYARLDLLDLDGLTAAVKSARPDIVIHLAALAFVGHGSPTDFYTVNVIGTRNLLEAITKSGVEPTRVVIASSANIYGNSIGGRIPESTPPNPENDYAVSKFAMEKMAQLWRHRLPITLVRPFNYTGVGQSANFLVPKIVKHFLDRAPRIALGNLEVSRDFSDVRDIAKFYRLIAEQHSEFKVLNMCSGSSVSLGTILEMATTISGHELEVEINPAFVRTNEVKTLCGDASSLEALIGTIPRTHFTDTLAWMLTQTP